MKAIIDGDLVTGFADGDVGSGVEVPEGLRNMRSHELRFRNGEIIDATALGKFWIDEKGEKHVEQLDPSWQELSAKLGDALRHNGSKWIVVPKTQLRRDTLHALAARLRFKKETGGIEVSGLKVETDERTTAFLTGAYARAKFDAAFTIPRWKIGPGSYIALSNEQIIALGEAVADHIQHCFDLNEEADAKIAADEFTVAAQVEGFFAAG